MYNYSYNTCTRNIILSNNNLIHLTEVNPNFVSGKKELQTFECNKVLLSVNAILLYNKYNTNPNRFG